jgi:hypothetical protein
MGATPMGEARAWLRKMFTQIPNEPSFSCEEKLEGSLVIFEGLASGEDFAWMNQQEAIPFNGIFVE